MGVSTSLPVMDATYSLATRSLVHKPMSDPPRCTAVRTRISRRVSFVLEPATLGSFVATSTQMVSQSVAQKDTINMIQA